MKKLLFISIMAAFVLSGCKTTGTKSVAQGDVIHPYSIGFQLYSVRNDLEKDFYGTLKKVRDLGYTGVEFYNEYAGNSIVDVKRMCTELGLIPFSNHVPFQVMMDDLDRVIEENTILGVQYITFPYMDEASRPGVDPERFKETVARIGEIGAKVKQAGFQLLYHNHDFEFVKLPDGTLGHDYIFSSTAPGDVMVELDACWADYAGYKCDQIIPKYKGRIPVIHIKDYYKEGELSSDPYALIGIKGDGGKKDAGGKFEFRPLGAGIMDLPGLVDVSLASGVRWLCVEQDDPAEGASDWFEGPAQSIVWLRENGLL
jgi:Sugar phosphate isomerases/epimerases